MSLPWWFAKDKKRASRGAPAATPSKTSPQASGGDSNQNFVNQGSLDIDRRIRASVDCLLGEQQQQRQRLNGRGGITPPAAAAAALRQEVVRTKMNLRRTSTKSDIIVNNNNVPRTRSPLYFGQDSPVLHHLDTLEEMNSSMGAGEEEAFWLSFSGLKVQSPERSDQLGPLPSNWEKRISESGRTFFFNNDTGTSHWLDPRLSSRQQQQRDKKLVMPVVNGPRIVSAGDGSPNVAAVAPNFTRDPNQLLGERHKCRLVKSLCGLGFTIVGGDDKIDEFLHIKSIVPNGPAWKDGTLKEGDVLVYVNAHCVLGFTHQDMVTMFKSMPAGEVVDLEVSRGHYPLPFDSQDPNTEIVTSVAIASPREGDLRSEERRLRNNRRSMQDLSVVSNSSDRRESDLTLSINLTSLGSWKSITIPIMKGGMGFGFTIDDTASGQTVRKVLDRPWCKNLQEGDVLVKVDDVNVLELPQSEAIQVLRRCPRGKETNITIRRWIVCNAWPSNFKREKESPSPLSPPPPLSSAKQSPCHSMFLPTYPTSPPRSPLVVRSFAVADQISPAGNLHGHYMRAISPGYQEHNGRRSVGSGCDMSPYGQAGGASYSHLPKCEDYGYSTLASDYSNAHRTLGKCQSLLGSFPLGQKRMTSFEPPLSSNCCSQLGRRTTDWMEMTVTLQRTDAGFGFRIVGGAEEGSQPSIGYIVVGGPAAVDGRLLPGDEIVKVDEHQVINRSHQHVVALMSKAACAGKVDLTVARKIDRPVVYPYDVKITRNDAENFGFVITTNVPQVGSVVSQIIRDSPADRCGRLSVGDRILAINHVDINNDIEDGNIVNIIKDSGYNVIMTVGIPIDGNLNMASNHNLETRGHGPREQLYLVTLRRSVQSFGFSIRGGSEFDSVPLTVMRIAPDGPAATDGRLQVDDQIVEINGVSTRGMTHGEAIELVKGGGDTVSLLVAKRTVASSRRPVGSVLSSGVERQNDSLLRNDSFSLGRRTNFRQGLRSNNV